MINRMPRMKPMTIPAVETLNEAFPSCIAVTLSLACGDVEYVCAITRNIHANRPCFNNTHILGESRRFAQTLK